MTWLDRKSLLAFLFFFGILLFSSYFFEPGGFGDFGFDLLFFRRVGMAAAIALVIAFFMAKARRAMEEN